MERNRMDTSDPFLGQNGTLLLTATVAAHYICVNYSKVAALPLDHKNQARQATYMYHTVR